MINNSISLALLDSDDKDILSDNYIELIDFSVNYELNKLPIIIITLKDTSDHSKKLLHDDLFSLNKFYTLNYTIIDSNPNTTLISHSIKISITNYEYRNRIISINSIGSLYDFYSKCKTGLLSGTGVSILESLLSPYNIELIHNEELYNTVYYYRLNDTDWEVLRKLLTNYEFTLTGSKLIIHSPNKLYDDPLDNILVETNIFKSEKVIDKIKSSELKEKDISGNSNKIRSSSDSSKLYNFYQTSNYNNYNLSRYNTNDKDLLDKNIINPYKGYNTVNKLTSYYPFMTIGDTVNISFLDNDIRLPSTIVESFLEFKASEKSITKIIKNRVYEI